MYRIIQKSLKTSYISWLNSINELYIMKRKFDLCSRYKIHMAAELYSIYFNRLDHSQAHEYIFT